MDDVALLLKAILDNPAEDVPRLMYADAVEESDPARAEFVRVQVEIARTDACPAGTFDVERRHHVKRREFDLLQEDDVEDGNWIRWLPAGSPLVLFSHPHAALNMRCAFRRGFVDRVECRAADWRRWGATIAAMHPVERVALTDFPKNVYAWRFAAVDRADPSKGQTSARWPGIVFTLPSG